MARKILLKYPKLTLLAATFLIAYILLRRWESLPFSPLLVGLGYFGMFIVGMLYSYGFTAAPATAFFLTLGSHENLLANAVFGGFGSLVSDVILFDFIRHSFMGEVKLLSREKPVQWLLRSIPEGIKKHVFVVIAAAIIASPFPDELGIVLLASYRDISANTFMILSFFLNTTGILGLLWAGTIL